MGKRYNFTEKTKRTAAEKVAYFCSNPKCGRLTVASSEDGNAHHYGEAAHIYAASADGPRGSSNLSNEELTSESNCLWLCNSCHELIDSNPRLYNPELLKEWKKTAEKRAFDIVANPDKAKKLIEEIKTTSGLKDYFNELFQLGDFQKVITAIYELSKKELVNDNDKEELHFAQTRFDAFCARKNLFDNLHWLNIASQNIKERLVDFAIACYDRELCEQVKFLSANQAKRDLASMIGDGAPFEEVTKWLNVNSSKVENSDVVHSSLVAGGVKNCKVLIDDKNNLLSFRGDWFLNTCDTILGFVFDTANKKVIDEKRMQFFLDNIDVFSWLDEYYISLFFDNCFNYFPRGRTLGKLLLSLIEKGVSTSNLRINYFFAVTPKEKHGNLMEKALELGIKYDDHRLLSYALMEVSFNNPERVIKFFEDNCSYLFEDLLFLDPYRSAKQALKQPFDVLEFLLKQYNGEKNSTYYLICAHSYFLNKDKESMATYWNKYKESLIDYYDEYIIMALEIAFNNNDSDFIKDFCTKSMSVDGLLYAGNKIVNKDFDTNVVLTIIERLESLFGNLPNNYNGLMFFLCCKVQKYEKAIRYGMESYFKDKNIKIAPYVIQTMIDLAIYDENEFISDVAKNTLDPYSLNLLGQFYLKSKKVRDGWNFIARSIPLHNKLEDLSFYGPFVQCELLNTKSESNEYSYVIVEDNKSFLLLPPEERKYFGDKVFGTPVFYTDDKSDFCFLLVNDTVKLDDKKYKVKEIYDYFYFFHSLAIQQLIASPSTITFSGKDPKEAVNQIIEYVKNSETEQEDFLKSTSNLPLPFSFFNKSFGKGIFESIESLYFSKHRNSFFVFAKEPIRYSIDLSYGLLFDIEMVYLAYKLGVSIETIQKDNCLITSLTKGALLNEISEKENVYKGNSEKGLLAYSKESDRAVFIENTQKRRRDALKELSNLNKYVNSFSVISPNLKNISKDQSDVLNLFRKEKDSLDAETLTGLWSGCNLVSNNQMFYIGKQLGSGNVIDLSEYLSISSCSALEAINVVKNMKSTNIKQYLTPNVFDSIMKKIDIISKPEDKKTATSAMVELILGNWDGNWIEEEIKIHKQIVYIASSHENSNLSKRDEIHIALRTIINDLIAEYFLEATNK